MGSNSPEAFLCVIGSIQLSFAFSVNTHPHPHPHASHTMPDLRPCTMRAPGDLKLDELEDLRVLAGLGKVCQSIHHHGDHLSTLGWLSQGKSEARNIAIKRRVTAMHGCGSKSCSNPSMSSSTDISLVCNIAVYERPYTSRCGSPRTHTPKLSHSISYKSITSKLGRRSINSPPPAPARTSDRPKLNTRTSRIRQHPPTALLKDRPKLIRAHPQTPPSPPQLLRAHLLI